MSAAVMLPVTHNGYRPAVRRQAETEEEGVWSRDDITSVPLPYEPAALSGCRQKQPAGSTRSKNRGVEKQFPQSAYVDMTRN